MHPRFLRDVLLAAPPGGDIVPRLHSTTQAHRSSPQLTGIQFLRAARPCSGGGRRYLGPVVFSQFAVAPGQVEDFVVAPEQLDLVPEQLVSSHGLLEAQLEGLVPRDGWTVDMEKSHHHSISLRSGAPQRCQNAIDRMERMNETRW
jgi:hypothetical protein